jgi:septal ring factor EnvC (AmiA/AmiB activator)
MKYFSFVVFFTLLALLSSPLMADDKKDELKKIEQKVEAEKARQAELKAAAEKIEKDMKGLKTNLIDATRSVQKNERALQEIEDKIEILQNDKKQITDKLESERKSLSDLIMALQRIRRLPPETLIARPDAPLETAQAATILSAIVPEINKRAALLKLDLEKLSEIETNLTEEKQDLEKTALDLKTDKTKMDKLLGERQKTLKVTRQELSSKEKQIASLTRDAKDVRDLIKKLSERQKSSKKTPKPAHNRQDDTGPALGTGRMPVSGIIKTRYGETDEIGATSQGLVIAGRAGSVVVAPLSGTVRYAGAFRNYGQIVLIEHKNKFHSLVAGLGKVDTVLGQSIDAGEPIGTLPSNSGRLYYELRYQGEPVNPSKKFSKLN